MRIIDRFLYFPRERIKKFSHSRLCERELLLSFARIPISEVIREKNPTINIKENKNINSNSINLSIKGAKFIMSWEGFESKMYNDAVGHCTIGYGHLLHKGRCNGTDVSEQPYIRGIKKEEAEQLFKKYPNPKKIPNLQGISIEEGEQLFSEDSLIFIKDIRKLLKVDTTQNQFDAIVSLAYNIGMGNFKKSSLLKKINIKEFQEAGKEFLKWNKARDGSGQLVELKGLTRRRKSEANIFNLNIYIGAADKEIG